MNATNPGTSKARNKAPKSITETHADLWADSLNHAEVFPWYSPVAITGEMVQFVASRFNSGDELIAEIEG